MRRKRAKRKDALDKAGKTWYDCGGEFVTILTAGARAFAKRAFSKQKN